MKIDRERGGNYRKKCNKKETKKERKGMKKRKNETEG